MRFHSASLAFALLCSTVLSAEPLTGDGIEVAPGITLPASGTVYALDSLNKQTSLIQLHAAEVVANTHAGGNFARSMVYAGPQTSLEIPGISSAATLHTSQVILYVHLNGDDPELLRSRVQLVRLDPEKTRRVVLVFTMNIFGGHRTRHYQEVSVSKSDLPDGSWLKLTPTSALEPGEYCIAFVPKDVNTFADAVYDFSVGGDLSPKKKQVTGN